MAYTELREFNPPEALLHKEIPSEVLPAFGIDRDAPQVDLLLAQVMLVGSKEYGTWFVGALDATEPRIETSFGGIKIDNPTVSPEQVLQIAEDWVRDSDATEWVPGSILKLVKEDDSSDTSARGLLLVRAYDPRLRREILAKEKAEKASQNNSRNPSKGLLRRILSR